MNKKAITAIENKKLLKNIKKNNNIKFDLKKIINEAGVKVE